MGENKANRSDRATEPDLPPTPQVPGEELPPPPQVPQEDLSSAPEVPEEDLSPPPEVQSEDLSPPPEVDSEESSPLPEAPEAQTSKERTSDERTEALEEPQGSEGARRSAASEAMTRNLGGKWGPILRAGKMLRESQLEQELEQAEEVYDGLIQTRRSLGTMLAETIRKKKDLEEFKRHLRDLPHLIWQADLRRTELRHELLDRRAKRAEAEYRRAAEEASKAARALEQARTAYVKAEETAKPLGLEARRLAQLRDNEAAHLQELRWAPEDAQRYQGEYQRGEQGGEQGEKRGGGQEVP